MSGIAPVALFVYNRPEHTRRTVDALKSNTLAPCTALHVFCDAARNADALAAVNKVRAYVAAITGFASVTVVQREVNLGLARSIIDGVSALCRQYGRVIVLEDDLVTSPHFLTYMNQGLDRYRDEDAVSSICGYMYPVDFAEGRDDPEPGSLFLPLPHSWGWATWQRSWAAFDADGERLLRAIRERGLTRAFNANGPHNYVKMLEDQIAGRNDSWFVRWYAATFLEARCALYPAKSLVCNTGIDGSGSHCAAWKIDPYAATPSAVPICVNRRVAASDPAQLRVLSRYYAWIRIARYLNFFYRHLARLKRLALPLRHDV
jgi:hypothetical protein